MRASPQRPAIRWDLTPRSAPNRSLIRFSSFNETCDRRLIDQLPCGTFNRGHRHVWFESWLCENAAAGSSTAPDPPLRRSASSIPPQNHQENLSSAPRFHTARVTNTHASHLASTAESLALHTKSPRRSELAFRASCYRCRWEPARPWRHCLRVDVHRRLALHDRGRDMAMMNMARLGVCNRARNLQGISHSGRCIRWLRHSRPRTKANAKSQTKLAQSRAGRFNWT